VDPIVIAAHTVLNLQQIQTREMSINEPCALTVGMLQAGDTANVIPDSAVLRGSLRAFDDEAHQYLIRRMEEIAKGTAALFHGSAQVERLGGAPTLLNDEQLSGMAQSVLMALLGDERVLLSSELGGDSRKSSGSEDFANISHDVPSLMVALAAGEPAEGYAFPAHHPKTAFDEAALPIGAAVYAFLALETLKM
jgi:hippurate hydrolase